MLKTSARLLRLLSLLQSRRDWTGPELAVRLGVGERTVRNDIERLRSLGYPVDATRGYRLGAGAALPPLLLDDDVDVLTTLAAACRDTERVRFDYRTHRGAATRRDVEPYRLVVWGRRWYLLAWDVERADWRTFRVDRMRPRAPSGPRFAPRPLPDDDISACVSQRVSAAAWRYHAEVIVHAPADEVAPRIPPAAGRVEPRDADTCVLHTGSDSLDSLVVHISLLGADVDVTGPPELVERIRVLAGRYARATPEAGPGATDVIGPPCNVGPAILAWC